MRITVLLIMLFSATFSQVVWPDKPGMGYEKPVRLTVFSNSSGTISPGFINFTALVSGYNITASSFTVLENNTSPVQAFYLTEKNLVFLYWNATPNTTYYVYAGSGEGNAVQTEPNVTSFLFYLINPNAVKTKEVYVYPWYDLSEPYCHDHDNSTCYGWLEHNVTGFVYKLSFQTKPLLGWKGLVDGCYQTSFAPGAYTVFNYSASVLIDGQNKTLLHYNHTGSEFNWNGVPWPPETKYPGENTSLLFLSSPLAGEHEVRVFPFFHHSGYSCHYTIPNSFGQQNFGSEGKIGMDSYSVPVDFITDYAAENRTSLMLSCPSMLSAGENVSVNITNTGTENPVKVTVSVGNSMRVMLLNTSLQITTNISSREPDEKTVPVRVVYSGRIWEKYCRILFYNTKEDTTGTITANNNSLWLNASSVTTAVFKHANTTTVNFTLCGNQTKSTSCNNSECLTLISCARTVQANSSSPTLSQTKGINSTFNGLAYYSRTWFLPNPLNTTFEAEFNNTRVTLPAAGLLYQQNFTGSFLTSAGPFSEKITGCVKPGEDPTVSAEFVLSNNGTIAFNASFSYKDNTSWFYIQPNTTLNTTLSYHVLRAEAEQLPGYKECEQPGNPTPAPQSFGSGGGGGGGGIFIPYNNPAPKNTSENKTNETVQVNKTSQTDPKPVNFTSQPAVSTIIPDDPVVVLSVQGNMISLLGNTDYCRILLPGHREILLKPEENVTVDRVGKTTLSYNCVKGNSSLNGTKDAVFTLPEQEKPKEPVESRKITGLSFYNPGFPTPSVILAGLGLFFMLILKKVKKHN